VSASEKLKALDAAFRASRTQRGQGDFLYRMVAVLPQLVALVDAAEATVQNAQLVADEEILLDRALAALDKALP